MPDTLITDLTDGSPAQSGDELVVNRSGADRKITAGSIAALVSGGLPVQLPIRDGAFYFSIGTSGVSGSFTTDFWQDTLVAVPIVFAEDVTLNRVSIRIATEEAGTDVVLGVYPSGANGLPDAENPIDSVVAELSTIGDIQGEVSAPCTAGETYWIAVSMEASAVAEFSTAATEKALRVQFYGAGDGGVGGDITCITASHTYDGTLPSPFGASEFYGDEDAPLLSVRAGV